MSELTGDAADFAAEIKSHGNRLLHTLDSLLELATIQKVGDDTAAQNVDIHEVTTEIVLMYQTAASAKNLALYVEAEPHRGSTVLPLDGAKYAIRAVIDNALKFTDEGRIRISICRDTEFIEVRIADTGIGISRSDQELIFEPFKQASEGLDRNHEGAGVGLTVARQFMHSMRGTLELESTGVDGSTFCVRFPAVGANSDVAIAANSARPGSNDQNHAKHGLAPVKHSSRLRTQLRSSTPEPENDA